MNEQEGDGASLPNLQLFLLLCSALCHTFFAIFVVTAAVVVAVVVVTVFVTAVAVNKAQIRDEDPSEGGLGCWEFGRKEIKSERVAGRETWYSNVHTSRGPTACN